MKELGADENGRISYKEFLNRRLALRPEIDALRSTPHHPRETPDYLPTSSDNSLGKNLFFYHFYNIRTNLGLHEYFEYRLTVKLWSFE